MDEVFDDEAGKLSLLLDAVPIRDVDEGAGLVGDGVRDFRMGVTERAHGDAASEVEVFFAGAVPEVRAFTALRPDRKAAVVGQDVLVQPGGVEGGISKGHFLTGRTGFLWGLLKGDLGADADVGEDFEDEGVGDATVDEVNFTNTTAKGSEGGVHLGDHAAGDDALVFEIGDVSWVE